MKYTPEECELVDDWLDSCTTDHDYIVISSFTVKTPYQAAAKKLADSMNEFSIPGRIYSTKSKGLWRDNCFVTNHIILKALRDYPDKNIVWIDADAYFQAYPKLFDDYKYDLGMYYRIVPGRYGGHRQCCSGTIFMRNFPPMHRFYEQFIQYLEPLDIYANAQRHFGETLEEDPDIHVDPDFPAEYCTLVVSGGLYIGKSIERAVIIQGHALREFGIIDKGCVV